MADIVPGVSVTPAEAGSWRTQLAERWNIGRNQNGGVVLAAVSAALAEAAGQPHPLAVTGHFLRPSEAGDAVVRAELVKPGRTYSTAVGQLWQGDRERLRAVGSFGDLAARAGGEGPAYAGAPPVPPPERCDDLFDILTAGPAGARSVTRSLRNFEIRVDPRSGWGPDQAGRPSLSGWIRFRDAGEVTAAMLIAVADAFPPTLLSARRAGWLPTVELGVHLFGLPGSGSPWLQASLRTSALAGGLLDEDGALWDASGRLVASFRQLAMILPG